jgi:hypothetical protein
MKPDSPIRYRVTKQGFPTIQAAAVHAICEHVAALDFDFETKSCEFDAETTSEHGLPVLIFSHEAGDDTEIELLDFAGWDVWCASTSRFSVCVCLVKG